MRMKTFFSNLMFQTEHSAILNKDGCYKLAFTGRGFTASVVRGVGFSHVGEDPDIVVVAMGIERDLLLIGAAGVHVVM